MEEDCYIHTVAAAKQAAGKRVADTVAVAPDTVVEEQAVDTVDVEPGTVVAVEQRGLPLREPRLPFAIRACLCTTRENRGLSHRIKVAQVGRDPFVGCFCQYNILT